MQQQEWLVSGLLELYRRTQIAFNQPNHSPTGKDHGDSLVYDILEGLGVFRADLNQVVADPVVSVVPWQANVIYLMKDPGATESDCSGYSGARCGPRSDGLSNRRTGS